jgi:hypothetical protein
MIGRAAIATLLALAACLAAAHAQSAAPSKPKVPPGRDPGGVAIALITTGIDYTDPRIAPCLARDGEGELIGWDMVDRDRRPFGIDREKTPPNWGGDGSVHARALQCGDRARLIPVRVDPADPMSFGNALAFIAQTPSRIAVLPMWSERAEDWEMFRRAAEQFKDILVIAAAGDERRDIDAAPVWPAAFKLPNVVVVSTGIGDARQLDLHANTGVKSIDAVVLQGSTDRPGTPEAPHYPSGWAAMQAAWSLACASQDFTHMPAAAELKARLVSLMRPSASAGGHRLLDPQCKVTRRAKTK